GGNKKRFAREYAKGPFLASSMNYPPGGTIPARVAHLRGAGCGVCGAARSWSWRSDARSTIASACACWRARIPTGGRRRAQFRSQATARTLMSISNQYPTLDFDLGETADQLRDTVRAFTADEIAPIAEEIDRTDRFPRELWPRMGALGLHGITVEEEYGGSGLGYLEHVVAMEEVSRGSA